MLPRGESGLAHIIIREVQSGSPSTLNVAKRIEAGLSEKGGWGAGRGGNPTRGYVSHVEGSTNHSNLL